jgi:glycosyltransferase involved in cell wall biosynthesis
MSPKRVLVLSNSVDRSGAPIALLRLMRWCVDHDVARPTFIAREGGELLDEFRSLAPTYRLSQGRENTLQRVLAPLPGGRAAATGGRLLAAQWLRRLCRRRKIELIYANTATHYRVISALESLELPVVTHVHELEQRLKQEGVADELEPLIARSQWLLAVSTAVREMLVRHGADERRILDVPGSLEDSRPLTPDERRRYRREVLQVEDDAIVVAACGSPSLIKGTDIFLRVAQKALSGTQGDGNNGLVFRWIGAPPGNEVAQYFDSDAVKLGIGGRVRTTPVVERADRLVGAVDIFVSPSREDSNPLGALEAAATGRPVVCFRGTGGAEDLIDAGGGFAVPYLDSDAMAEAVARLAGSPQQRTELGDAGREFVMRRHSSDVVGRQVADLFGTLAPVPQ